ncbi:MAG TPA: hypothetical protein VFW48_07360 [Solirubrobacterales bacterium]|nr:hypothetical protein [Solirubrobacterales bacterium]
MLRSSTVTSPDGHRWRVGRRWVDRSLPDLRRRFRANSERTAEDGGDFLNALTLPDFDLLDFDDSPLGAIAIAIGALLLFLVLLPLIGIALELIVLLVLLWSGVVGRVLFGRPWIVAAADLDDPERSATFAVKGWRRSGQATEELKRAITVAGTPNIETSD